jgi:hypothetical protein
MAEIANLRLLYVYVYIRNEVAYSWAVNSDKVGEWNFEQKIGIVTIPLS